MVALDMARRSAAESAEFSNGPARLLRAGEQESRRGLLPRSPADARAFIEHIRGIAMIIALLAVLGVDLIVIVAFVVFVLGRRHWVSHQPGAFRGAIRVTDGEVNGLGTKWKRGYGRWVRDVLIWTKAPLLLWNEFVVADAVDATALPGDIKRLGDNPVAVRLRAGAGTAEVVAAGKAADLLAGPYDVNGAHRAVTQPVDSSPQ